MRRPGSRQRITEALPGRVSPAREIRRHGVNELWGPVHVKIQKKEGTPAQGPEEKNSIQVRADGKLNIGLVQSFNRGA